jgi:hypothetical protein
VRAVEHSTALFVSTAPGNLPQNRTGRDEYFAMLEEAKKSATTEWLKRIDLKKLATIKQLFWRERGDDFRDQFFNRVLGISSRI